MKADFVRNELGLCEETDCMGNFCHVMIEIKDRPGCFAKYCPILFNDAVKPKWRVEDLI
jgi:hypothetical protein